VTGEGWEARVFLGALLGETSPVGTATPLLGAELRLTAGTELHLDVDPDFEHGVLVDTGVVSLGDVETKQHELAYLPPGSQRLTLEAVTDARVLLLGGPPFGEAIVMWWNFVGRSHADIAAYRRLWETHDIRFDAVDGYRGSVERLPAPPLPNTTLRPRPRAR
jgi:redox-sensitive bicupin YhaK (pirin superfamily)